MTDDFNWLEPMDKLIEENKIIEMKNKLKTTEHNLPVPDDAPWLNLSPQEIEELRKSKIELTAYATQKLRKLKAQNQAQKIVNETIKHTLRPKNGDRERVIAEAFRELIHQCGYTMDKLIVVDVRDILGIIEVLEE